MLHILLVDDDATDREFFAEAIHLTGKNCVLHEAANGEEALQLLHTAPLPQLIILDLNMPVKDGRETLKELKTHDAYKSIPVCILSTSSAHFDVLSAYNAGANLFLVKPLDFNQLTSMVETLVTLFNQYVILPDTVKKEW